MRNFVLLIIGIGLGALITATLVNALNRHAAYPRGVMEVMQHHYGTLRVRVRDGRCDRTSLAPHKSELMLLTDEIEPSMFGEATAEPPFREYLVRLRAALSELPSSEVDCSVLAPIVAKIGNACDACHRQYR